eukprot:CAMPEP_0119558950 /NCGR_PEP_ID=MMETSP1352-20130426/11715_1 /TAXON_ID=265584 /ORGANISM="Stauroneis constricta, Strain CCMP1120" /LENGTH=81 /DNA_ID=CAMNT_0007606479 /DNA_START=154 /DNA_END=399 /DNA_ORIENTATION=-
MEYIRDGDITLTTDQLHHGLGDGRGVETRHGVICNKLLRVGEDVGCERAALDIIHAKSSCDRRGLLSLGVCSLVASMRSGV